MPNYQKTLIGNQNRVKNRNLKRLHRPQHLIVVCDEVFDVDEVSAEVFMIWLALHFRHLAQNTSLQQLKKEAGNPNRQAIQALAEETLNSSTTQYRSQALH